MRIFKNIVSQIMGKDGRTLSILDLGFVGRLLVVSFAFYLSLTADRLPLVHAAFEQIGAGARPIGMASAFTAVSDDAHAVYYNPAGLVQARQGELTAGYGKLYSGLKDNSNLNSGFVGAVQPLRSGRLGTVGLGWLSLNLQDAYREDTIGLSYAKEAFKDGLFLGGTGKVLKRSFGSDIYTQVDPLFIQNGYDTTNVSFDLGMMYRPSAAYSFALMLKDLNQPDVGLAARDRVPLEVRGGMAYRQRAFVFDGEISKKDTDLLVAMGFEKWFFKNAGFRSGFAAGSRSRREITAGMSYKGESFAVDYAFIFPLGGIESTAGSHRFGLTVRFGKKPEKARWEFEQEEALVERILEEKAAQIAAMEKQLEDLRELGRTEKLENTWVRSQIQKLEDKLRIQESKDLEAMKNRLFESKIETEKMKQRIRDLEERIQRSTAPRAPVRRAEPEAKPEAPAPTPVVTPQAPRTYVVQEGDTLQSIAEKMYGKPDRWIEVYELNSDRVERGGTVRPGQVLLLPAK